jgi:hypothetical protein
MEMAGESADRLCVLPFPLYQWREVFVTGLAALLQAAAAEREEAAAEREEAAARRERDTLARLRKPARAQR